MKIVIDIPEDIYGRCREYRLHCGEAEVLEGAVANGTPLPSEENTDGYLISREVVIEWLKGKDIIKLSSQEEMARKELKALSSVELQPCVENMPRTDGDLISRQAAIDIVVFECGKWTGLAKEISKQLKQLPSADNTAECDNNHDCEHCDWTECPLEAEKESKPND